MSPAVIAMIMQLGLIYGPEMVDVARKMFSKPSGVAPTDAEWAEFKSRIPKDIGSYYADAEARAAAIRAAGVVAGGGQ